MNINAKQMLSVDYHSMDNTTALGFFGQIKDIVTQDAQVTAALMLSRDVKNNSMRRAQ